MKLKKKGLKPNILNNPELRNDFLFNLGLILTQVLVFALIFYRDNNFDWAEFIITISAFALSYALLFGIRRSEIINKTRQQFAIKKLSENSEAEAEFQEESDEDQESSNIK